MTQLILGLILFLGAHSVRIWADGWRNRTIEAYGDKAFKGVHALVSLLGFYLLLVGYGEARLETVALWNPPIFTKHISILLMLLSSILLVATYVPRNHFKMRLGHPMVLSVKVWALSHLLANGNLADLVLFGSFLIWAVLNFRSARARDRVLLAESESTNLPKMFATLITLGGGMALWALITFVLHAKFVGVAPMG
ncbi:MAG: NnrU family protein [Burkholderiales bacterium]|nr:NnrU family protein [Burkholderiales bacterium]